MNTLKTKLALFLLLSTAILFSCNRTVSYGGGKKGGSGSDFSVGKKTKKHVQHQNPHKKK